MPDELHIRNLVPGVVPDQNGEQQQAVPAAPANQPEPVSFFYVYAVLVIFVPGRTDMAGVHFCGSFRILIFCVTILTIRSGSRDKSDYSSSMLKSIAPGKLFWDNALFE